LRYYFFEKEEVIIHHFISYSNFDGLDDALKLTDFLIAGPPSISAWIDKRNLQPIGDWDTQIDHAIRTCESLIFVMTRDSVEETSVCKNEWTQALKFKKSIVPIRIHPDINLPFRLNSRQFVDFSSNFDTGLASLRKYLQWLLTTEGQLQSLKYRLEDAQRDLKRATEDDRPRVMKDIEELKVEINRLEKIIKSPETAIAQSQESIKIRIESERQSPPRFEIEKRTKFVNPPPMSAPDFFQDRLVETRIITDFLKTDSLRMMTLVGRGGIGKTAMVCRLLKSLERGLLPDDLGKFEAGGIIYLSEVGIHKIGFANLFADLCRLLPPDIANYYEKIYKEGQKPIRFKMFSLLEEFRTEPVIILFDNLENLIDPTSCSLTQDDLREALNALLDAPHHSVKVIITTRIPPKDIFLFHPERQQSLQMNSGLGSPYAENLLRALDLDGSLGLKNAPDTILNKVRENTRGFPRALEAFFGSLAADRSTTPEELLSKIQHALPQEIVEIMVGEAFSRLDKSAQRVMQALAIFSRPVPPVAVDFLLQPYIETPDSAQILNRLVNMHFVRREMGRYYLHPVDLSYALSLFPSESQVKEDAQQASFSPRVLRKRASDYFHQIRRPREEWKTLADLEPQLAEFDLRCAVEDWETALLLLHEINNEYLILWGHAGLVVDMSQKLLGKLIDERSNCLNLMILGSAYLHLGNNYKTIDYCGQALHLSEKTGLQNLEAVCLGSSAIANRRLGKISKAIEMYERSLLIHRNLFMPGNEASTLNNLGVAFRYLGLLKKSIKYHEQALEIDSRIRNLRHFGIVLGTISVSFRYTGQLQKSVEYCHQALAIARSEKDRSWEAYHLAELGSSYLDLGNISKGSEFLKEAIEIAHETADNHWEAVWAVRPCVKELLFGDLEDALNQIKCTAKLAEGTENSQYDVDFRIVSAMAKLRSDQLEEALNMIKPILQTEYELNLPEILILNGIILLRQKKSKEATQQFIATIRLADRLLEASTMFYSALEAKGLAACGLAICEKKERMQHISLAIKCYRDARSIVTAPGVVKRALFFFDECAKADDQGILSEVRCEIEANI
jgi:tetratricopeptide (TPR) repeat protein